MTLFRRIVVRYRESLILALYIILSFIAMTTSESRIIEGLRSTVLFSVGVLENTLHHTTAYFGLYEENLRLRQENTRLAYQNFRLQDALLENIRLRRLLQFKYETAFDFIPAKIIGFSPQDFVTGFLLSTEDLDQIQKNTAVISTDGLVGKIVKVSGDYAICQNLFDPNSRVSVRVQRNRELGIISWDGGEGLLLQNIPNTIEIKPGDVVFTSGLSRIFPPKLKVGTVTSVKINNQQLFQTIKVKPAVNFNRLEEVAILKDMNPK
ncbi:MAG: rod shape-determining protein MreC [Caldithrix sp.]|nr:rod shape-determining protein MreC [Caldithrix sp.]